MLRYFFEILFNFYLHCKENISRINWWNNGSAIAVSADDVIFTCNNQEHINTLFVCDAIQDCSDGSDEANCSK